MPQTDVPRKTSSTTLRSHSTSFRSGHITADMRLGSCRASTQIAFGNFSYPQTLCDIHFLSFYKEVSRFALKIRYK